MAVYKCLALYTHDLVVMEKNTIKTNKQTWWDWQHLSWSRCINYYPLMYSLRGFFPSWNPERKRHNWHTDFHFFLSIVICDLSFLRQFGREDIAWQFPYLYLRRHNWVGFSELICHWGCNITEKQGLKIASNYEQYRK